MKRPDYLAATHNLITLEDDLAGFHVMPLAIISTARSYVVVNDAGEACGKAKVSALASEPPTVVNDQIHDQVCRIVGAVKDGILKERIREEDIGDARSITTHFDGHGLNDKIEVSAENNDIRGVAHDYLLLHDGVVVGKLLFQKGARDLPDSRAGLTEAAVLAVIVDRLECFQRGPFACAENEEQLTHLRAAMSATKARADERARRGVLGKEKA